MISLPTGRIGLGGSSSVVASVVAFALLLEDDAHLG